jgi:SAM-dependent methyltransferase
VRVWCVPAGDFDYEQFGSTYGTRRKTDPRIENLVHSALGDSRSVINVGAGTGSYEPRDRYVVAIEPSASMRAQRPPERVPAIEARAANLPFGDGAFEAAMAMVTIHQWPDAEAGLRELRRVSRGPVVVLTFDGDVIGDFWLAEYAPELVAAERTRYPEVESVCRVLGGEAHVCEVPVPLDCFDGFTEAFYGRPEAFLEEDVRRAQSAWGFLDAAAEARSIERLRVDLDSGAWDRHHGHLRSQAEYIGSLRLITARPLL